jgi:hypothetical protein
MDPRDDRDRPQRQELANSLTLEQNKRWAHLLEVARDLPASHAQWRFVIEALTDKLGMPTRELAAYDELATEPQWRALLDESKKRGGYPLGIPFSPPLGTP